MKTSFTTGEVAQYCHVHPQTIIKWCDANKIKTFKTPGGNRKVLRQDLITFLTENNFPVEGNLVPANQSILVVDSEPFYYKVLKDIFGKAGIKAKCDYTKDSYRALFLIGLHKPHLVIWDLTITDVDWVHFYKMVRAAPETEHIKVLFLIGSDTDYSEMEDIFKGYNVQYWLKKPLKKDEVIDVVEKILKT